MFNDREIEAHLMLISLQWLTAGQRAIVRESCDDQISVGVIA